MPMPASEPIADPRQRLEQLNQLEVDRTRAKKTGRSALVCSGCHMSLPTGLQAEVQRESTPLQCDNCWRFIFAAKETVEPEPSVKVSPYPSGRRSDPFAPGFNSPA